MHTCEQKGKETFSSRFIANDVANANDLIGFDKKLPAPTKPEITQKVIINLNSQPESLMENFTTRVAGPWDIS